MTHDILQTDISLAVKLIADQRSDDEIILALVHRGVDPGPAALLVEELRSGKKVAPQSTAHLEFTPGRRSHTKSPAHGTASPAPAPSPLEEEPRREPPPRPATPGQHKPAVLWLVTVILTGLAITVGGIILFQRHHAKTASPEVAQPKAAMPNATATRPKAAAPATPASPTAVPSPLVLELQPDGLRLGGSLVTGGNVLTTVAGLLGVPTRTNLVGQTDTVIYAYDRQGLLIYSPKGGGMNSIVLDCEGSGGTNGTTLPFTGSLKIEGQAVGPDTEAQALAGIKKLELKHPGAGGSVWGGRYNGLDLVFAYLKSPRHLSLIEIDLK